MEYYNASVKKTKVLIHEITWDESYRCILSEKSQNYCTLPFILISRSSKN